MLNPAPLLSFSMHIVAITLMKQREMSQMGVWQSSLRMHARWTAFSDGGFVIIDDPFPPGSELGLVAKLTKVPEE